MIETLRAALSDFRSAAWKILPLCVVPAVPAALLVSLLECEGDCKPMGWMDQSQIISQIDLLLGAPAAVAAIRLLLRRDQGLASAVRFAASKWSSSSEIRIIVGFMTSIGLFLPAVPIVVLMVMAAWAAPGVGPGVSHLVDAISGSPLGLAAWIPIGAALAVPVTLAVTMLTALALPALALGASDANAALIASRIRVKRAFWPLVLVAALATVPELAIEGAFDLVGEGLARGFWSDFALLTLEITLSGWAGAIFLAAMGEAYVRLSSFVATASPHR